FRDEVRDGTITLAFRPPGTTADAGWPTKVIPFKARLNRPRAVWLGYIAIFILLLLGGICSLLLSNWVPNQTARGKLKARLGQLAERMRHLSPRIDSKLQVSLRVARQQLRDGLYARASYSAELPGVLAAVAQRTEELEKLVAQAEEIDRGLSE